MSKVELDDGILEHPKFVRAIQLAGADAWLLWCGLRVFCAQQLTDGLVPKHMLSEVRGPTSTRRRRVALDALLTVGLLESCDSGVRLHDYLDWSSSRAQVLAWRSANSERKRKSRERSRCDTSETPDKSQRDNTVTGEESRCDTSVRHGVSHAGIPEPSPSPSRISDLIPPNPPGGAAVAARDPSRPKPADPMRASYKTQCPERLDFTEAHRGLAKRGSIDIGLEWRSFSKKAHASTKHLSDWGAAFEAHLAECVGRIERAAAFRATDRNAQRGDALPSVASDRVVNATPAAPPASEARPRANPEASRKLHALVGGIG